jgi:hypothetical protein
MSSDLSASPSATSNAPTPLLLFTNEEAQAIWARAAHLQAESLSTAPIAAGARDTISAGQAQQPLTERPAGMFFAHDLIQSAREAGIDAAHMAVALAEHEAAEHETAIVPSDAQRARFVRELGSDMESVGAHGLVAGTRDHVVEQLRNVFGRPPWELAFDGVVSTATEAGDVLRFQLPPWLATSADGASNAGNGFVYHAHRIGVPALHVLLEPRGTSDQPLYAVTVTADLRHGLHADSDLMRVLHVVMPGLFAITAAVLTHASVGTAPWLSATSALGFGTGLAAGVAFMRLVRRIMSGEHRAATRVLERNLQGMLRTIGRPTLPDSTPSPSAAPP